MLLAVGAHFHTSAFGKTAAAVSESNLPAFLGSGFKVLWLQDSIVTNILAIIFAAVAIKPAAPKWIIIVLALVPIATAGLVYYFIGNFYGGHVFLIAGIAAVIGALLLTPSIQR